MPGPHAGTNIADIVRHALFTDSRIDADPKTKHLGDLIKVPLGEFMANLGARNAAENAVMKAEAKEGLARDELIDGLEPFSLKLAAHYGSKGHADYKRVLKKSPAQYEAVPQRDLPKAMDDLEAAVQDADTPAAVKKLAGEFVGLVGAWRKAKKDLTDANAALGKAQKAVQAGKVKLLEGFAKLDGRLRDLFPLQRKKVARYFKATPRGKKPDVVVPEPPVEPKPDDGTDK